MTAVMNMHRDTVSAFSQASPERGSYPMNPSSIPSGELFETESLLWRAGNCKTGFDRYAYQSHWSGFDQSSGGYIFGSALPGVTELGRAVCLIPI